jgi:hypothetical protein
VIVPRDTHDDRSGHHRHGPHTLRPSDDPECVLKVRAAPNAGGPEAAGPKLRKFYSRDFPVEAPHPL